MSIIKYNDIWDILLYYIDIIYESSNKENSLKFKNGGYAYSVIKNGEVVMLIA